MGPSRERRGIRLVWLVTETGSRDQTVTSWGVYSFNTCRKYTKRYTLAFGGKLERPGLKEKYAFGFLGSERSIRRSAAQKRRAKTNWHRHYILTVRYAHHELLSHLITACASDIKRGDQILSPPPPPPIPTVIT